jgi:hypothetical protein
MNINGDNVTPRPAFGNSFAAAHVAGMLAFILDPQSNVGYVFPGGITTLRNEMRNRTTAIQVLLRLTHNSPRWYNDVVTDVLGTRLPVANFYVNQFLP